MTDRGDVTVYRGSGSGGSTIFRSVADQRSREGLAQNCPSPRSFTTCALKTPSHGGRSRGKINSRDLFTFSYKFNTDIPMSETQGVCRAYTLYELVGVLPCNFQMIRLHGASIFLQASIDEYLQNSPRIVGAVFPDQRKRRKLNDVSCFIVSSSISYLNSELVSIRTCLHRKCREFSVSSVPFIDSETWLLKQHLTSSHSFLAGNQWPQFLEQSLLHGTIQVKDTRNANKAPLQTFRKNGASSFCPSSSSSCRRRR